MNLDTFMENRESMEKKLESAVNQAFSKSGSIVEIELRNVDFDNIGTFRIHVSADYLYYWISKVKTSEISVEGLVSLARKQIIKDYTKGYREEIQDAIEESNGASLKQLRKIAEFIGEHTGL